ncbi:hypothetical protein DXG01_015020 [Tephrocybe rancida]|nr:hypothetical protein DXG01_015020 [Tephrocybe rancida]
MAPPGAILPTTWWNPGRRCVWLWRHISAYIRASRSIHTLISRAVYKQFNSEHFSVVPYISGAPTIFSSNLDVLRQVLSGDGKAIWQKPITIITPLAYRSVWTETLCTYRQMETAEGWIARDIIVVPTVQTITTKTKLITSTKFAFLVVAKCGFGFSFDWSAPPTGPSNRMSVQEALRILADSHIISMMAPNWVRQLPFPGFAQIRDAHQTFTEFMATEVTARKEEVRSGSEDSEERSDAFTMLVRSNEEETLKWRLDDQEVIGNVFIMLFAGHETTARALSAAFALLALHQDIQNEVVDQIIDVVGRERDPSLTTTAPAYLTIRKAVEDTVLHLPKPMGQEGTTPVAVQKGTNVVLDVVGLRRFSNCKSSKVLHITLRQTDYNVRYFPDPEEFRPSRWYHISSDSDTFSAFSLGQRACIGRKFATVEGVAFLTMLLRDWRIEPDCSAGETVDMWRAKVLEKPEIAVTLGVGAAPIKFVRRKYTKS